jgi:glycosyltransferase involved in cell wall biosynthesis/ubiquinone/menaquinone biosynthesis C-methylase UbiE
MVKEDRFGENYFKSQYSRYYEHRDYWKYFADKVYKSCLPDRTLDAGCGLGFLVSELKKFNVESCGVDISDFAVKSSEDPDVVLGDVENLPFKNEVFDLVVSSEVLEHLNNPKKAVAEFKRVLKDGGYIIITTPKPGSEYAKRDPTHINVQPEGVWIRYFGNDVVRYRHLEEVIRNIQANYYSKVDPETTIGRILSKLRLGYVRERLIKHYNDKNSIILVFKKGKQSEALFIHTPAFHHAHRVFAKAINADCLEVYFGEFGSSFKKFFLALKYGWRYPKYEYYILEGGIPLFPMMIKKLLKDGNSKVIGLLADETVINFTERLPYYSPIEVFIHKISSRYLNGAIAVSPMIKEYAQRCLKIPIKVVRPCIEEKTFEKLGKINPNLEERSVANVGYAKPSIGMDILVKAFEILGEGRLYVVGRGHHKEYERVRGVKVLGWVDNLAEVFRNVSLFVHPARSGAYPVATLEAMRAGVPTIVSIMTGTKDVVQEVEEEFKEEFGYYEGTKMVVSSDPVEVAKSIKWYFNLPIEAKEFLSERFRKKSERYHPRIVSKKFKKAFENLKEEIK